VRNRYFSGVMCWAKTTQLENSRWHQSHDRCRHAFVTPQHTTPQSHDGRVRRPTILIFPGQTSNGSHLTVNGHCHKPAALLYVQASTPGATAHSSKTKSRCRQAVSPTDIMRLYAGKWIIKRNWPAFNSKISLAMPLTVRRLPLEDAQKSLSGH
jgi:hypothetical protein